MNQRTDQSSSLPNGSVPDRSLSVKGATKPHKPHDQQAVQRRWFKSLNPYVPESLSRDGVDAVKIEESSVKAQAGKLILTVFLVFLLWSVTAPIDQGAVVAGSVVVLGARKAVQHPTGGVVEAILVREGDKVKEGDVLLRVNPLNIEANLLQAENEWINALAAYSRLLAERLDAHSIVWDRELVDFGSREQAIESRRLQLALFASRRSEHGEQTQLLKQQGENLQLQIQEKQKVLTLRAEQLSPIQQDAQDLRVLANDGYVPRTNAHSAERGVTEAQIALTTLQADIASLRTALSANTLELAKLRSSYQKEVDTQLAESQKAKETLRAKVISLRFDKSLAEVRSPASGVIVALKAHTVGGVIAGGQVLMEIVPQPQTLVIEAAVPPYLIDKIAVGMQVDLRFSAFNQITTPVIPGVVKLVGADRLAPSPPQYPFEYFLAQVMPTVDGKQLLSQKKIVPGMPVEVVVKAGERTFMSYLIKPLTDRFARSFKE